MIIVRNSQFLGGLEAIRKYPSWSKYFKENHSLLNDEELLAYNIMKEWQCAVSKGMPEYDRFECTSDGQMHFCHFVNVEDEVYTFRYYEF